MKPLDSFDAIQQNMEKKGMSLYYFSRPSCGVCGAIKPKVREILAQYPEIRAFDINLDQVPEAAGQLSIMTIPAVLVYADGKEWIREARYFSMSELSEKIRRPYEMLNG